METEKEESKEEEDVKISFLGTASMKPANYRGASAILVRSNQNYILLDCAEGSYGQMFDLFGKEAIDEAMRRLKCVYITHIHGDHQLGLLKIMQEKGKLMSEGETFYVVVPKSLIPWLEWHKEHNSRE